MTIKGTEITIISIQCHWYQSTCLLIPLLCCCCCPLLSYWQTFRSSNGTFYLYGAYHDNRPGVQHGPIIRLLGMIDRIEPTVKTHCLLWYDAAKDPVVTPVVEYKYVWNKKWGNYKQGLLQPYLMSCHLPQPALLAAKGLPSTGNPVPISVSVSFPHSFYRPSYSTTLFLFAFTTSSFVSGSITRDLSQT